MILEANKYLLIKCYIVCYLPVILSTVVCGYFCSRSKLGNFTFIGVHESSILLKIMQKLMRA